MKKNIKIAISGKSGCGNTTVSKLIAEILGLRFINFTFRNIAEERGLDLKTVLELASKDDFWDIEVDTRQVKMANQEEGCVLGSRLAIWMLDNADLKVYLKASAKTRAQRIVHREGGCLDEVALFTWERDFQDHSRYLRLYNINTNDFSFADLIVETDDLTPQQIADMIIKKANSI